MLSLCRRVLLIAPHADDELLGAGGTLLRLKELGAQIRLILVACSSVKLRRLGEVSTGTRHREFEESARELSTGPSMVYGFDDTRLDSCPLVELTTRLDDEIDDFKPDTILLPEPSYHQDHQHVHRACVAALRPNAHDPIARVLAYEVPTSTWSGLEDRFIPSVYVDISTTLEAKISIFQRCYRSQYTAEERRHLAEIGVRHHAAYRGIEAGLVAAEAFALLREIVK